MSDLREVLKEVWGSFTDTHRPYLTLGDHLFVLRKNKTYLEWGHESIFKYIENELHLPRKQYLLYLIVARVVVVKLKIGPEEYREVEKNHPILKVTKAAKVSKTKKEFFRRLLSPHIEKRIRRSQRVGPFIFSPRELGKLRAAGAGIGFPFDLPTREDILRLAINAIAYVRLSPDYKRTKFIESNYRRYKLFTRSQSDSTISSTKD